MSLFVFIWHAAREGSKPRGSKSAIPHKMNPLQTNPSFLLPGAVLVQAYLLHRVRKHSLSLVSCSACLWQ